MEKLTIGIVGLGNILASHLQALAQVPALRIIGVCDRDEEKRRKSALRLGVEAFAEYEGLLTIRPDIVLVSLPHGLHCEVTLDALEAGSHVLVEKPMAVGVDECRRMLSAAVRHSRHLLVTEAATFAPGALRTGEKFGRGDLGRFFTGSILNERFYFHDGRPAWFLDPAMSGGGMFANVGLHRLATARSCLPGLSPAKVSATVAHQSEWKVEACTSALVRYVEGASMLYEEVGYYPRPEWLNAGTHFVFEAGIVAWNERTWRLVDRNGEEWTEPLPPAQGYLPVYANLLKAMCGEAYGPHAWEYAVDTSIAQAAYASAHQGCEIDLQSPEWAIPSGQRCGCASP